MELKFDNVNQLPDVARQLLMTFPEERFYAFFGDMGVGKTTLIKAICNELGVTQNVCSPTFAIVNEYEIVRPSAIADAPPESEPVYHFDFYRLKNLDEAYDIGYEEYFYSGYYCFTEWTEKIEPLLPDSYLRIDIAESQGLRTLTANVCGNF